MFTQAARFSSTSVEAIKFALKSLGTVQYITQFSPTHLLFITFDTDSKYNLDQRLFLFEALYLKLFYQVQQVKS